MKKILLFILLFLVLVPVQVFATHGGSGFPKKVGDDIDEIRCGDNGCWPVRKCHVQCTEDNPAILKISRGMCFQEHILHGPVYTDVYLHAVCSAWTGEMRGDLAAFAVFEAKVCSKVYKDPDLYFDNRGGKRTLEEMLYVKDCKPLKWLESE